MSEPGFFEVVERQRAHRAFTDEPVDDATVERLLAAATRAPSAESSEPWVFVVVRDAACRAAIGELTRRAWEGHARDLSRERLAPNLFDDVDRGASGGLAAAPVIVIVAGDTQRCFPSALPASIFPAVQNLLLAAGALGLGSALTTLTTGYAEELREVVGLPEHLVPMAVVPLGHPARRLGRSRRRPVADVTHRDRFGDQWSQ